MRRSQVLILAFAFKPDKLNRFRLPKFLFRNHQFRVAALKKVPGPFESGDPFM